MWSCPSRQARPSPATRDAHRPRRYAVDAMFQVLDECPNCRVESAVAALFDPTHTCCLLGVAASSRCRLCGRATRGRVAPPCQPPPDASQRMNADRCPSCGDRMGEQERMDAQCGQCGIVARAEETRPGDRFRRAGDLERALGCWAREEGHDSADDFVASSFLDGDTGRIYERIRDGERVERIPGRPGRWRALCRGDDGAKPVEALYA